MKKIIVTGAGGPAGVNFVNSLRVAPEKFYIIALDTNPFHLEWVDANEKLLVPQSIDKDYIPELIKIIKRTKADFLHPQPDIDVKTISKNRDKLGTKMFLPNKKTVKICQDKYLSARTWKKSKISIQKAIYVTNTKKSLEIAGRTFGYPYWLRASQGASSKGSTPVPNINTAKSWLSYWKSRKIRWRFIAQEILPGRNIAFQSLWKDGKLITSCSRERIEYIYPQLAPSGVTNTPVIARTIHDERVNEIAQRSVLSIDSKATGIFCVDMKESKNGIPVPTEINCGRFFTTSFFFTKAGINMPYYYIKLGLGEKIPDLPKFNAIPANWYWIRHIDSPAVLVKNPSYAENY